MLQGMAATRYCREDRREFWVVGDLGFCTKLLIGDHRLRVCSLPSVSKSVSRPGFGEGGGRLLHADVHGIVTFKAAKGPGYRLVARASNQD